VLLMPDNCTQLGTSQVELYHGSTCYWLLFQARGRAGFVSRNLWLTGQLSSAFDWTWSDRYLLTQDFASHYGPIDVFS